jgi:hypothetical protein
MFRRLMLLVLCLGVPPLLAWGLQLGTHYYLTATHKFLDPKTQEYAFIGELVTFYLAGLMELRSRWSPSN